MNLARKYLQDNNQSLEDYDGWCGELANHIIGHDDSIIWVEGPAIQWKYHMVAMIDGLVHDAWCDGDALPLQDWLTRMFGDAWVEVSMNGDTVLYEGPANECRDAVTP